MVLDVLAARAVTRLALHYKADHNDKMVNRLEKLSGFPATKQAFAETTGYLNALKGPEDGYEVLQRLRHLIKACELDALGEIALEFAMAWMLLPQLPQIIGEGRKNITLEQVVEWADQPYSLPEDFLYLESMARRIGCILELENTTEPYFRRGFAADAQLMGYLCGGDKLPENLKRCCILLFWDMELPQLQEVHEECIEELAGQLSCKPKGWFQVSGEDGAEQKLVVEQACIRAGFDMLMVDFPKLCCHSKSLEELLWHLKREMLFFKMGVCLHHIDAVAMEDQAKRELIETWIEQMRDQAGPICFCTDEQTALIPMSQRAICRIKIPRYTRADRITLWQSFCMAEGIEGVIDCVDAGSRYQLTREEIRKALRLLKERPVITPQVLAEVCAEVLPPPRQGNIKKIAAAYTLDQLKLLPEQRQAIENICSHVRYRYQVYDLWNMESRYAYGRNVSALLVGPPGTGKTMAVHVMANMLQLPLYRIDLSQVVDKYIGETEKRLEEIFETAEKNNVILFFDEADSIFGKRSEVNEAKDRYANTEVSYILQRMEQYDGIVILATNYKKNIDEAFMRRMRYLVEFPLPGPALRLEIWKSAFAPQVPLEKVDFEYLSRQFELSGGSIKNIVLNSAFLAASRHHDVCMKDILESVRNENIKMGKTMLVQDFGQYGSLMTQDE